MSEGVLIAIIGAVQVITAALITGLISRMKRVESDTKATLAQTQNSHGTNLRDDIDGVRDLAEHAVRAARKASTDTEQLREDVQLIRSDMGGQASDIRGIRKDIGRLADGYIIAVDETTVELTKAKAEALGRWLLYEDNHKEGKTS